MFRKWLARRYIGPARAYLVLTRLVTGTGIFAVSGPIVKSTGSVGLLLVYWVLGPILTLGQ